MHGATIQIKIKISFCASEILMRLEFSRKIFEKCSNIKFHENPSSGSSSFAMRTDGGTNMMTLIIVFRNFAKVPKNT
jgi:hypothetical protein